MGIVYFIQCLETNEIYIGSTIQRLLCMRMSQHRYNKTDPTRAASKIINRGNYIYDVLEEVEDNDKLLEREQHYIDTTDCINFQRATGNVAVIDPDYHKKYNDKHSEKYKEVITCECGNTYTLRNKARHMRTKKHLSGIHYRHQATF